nr:hypothetical protein Iba_chr05cCG0390 [Ipomoea batatas]GME08504.1 hypothetical protein Iba_scaffold7717CG0030 [Ipomoea batatas]
MLFPYEKVRNFIFENKVRNFLCSVFSPFRVRRFPFCETIRLRSLLLQQSPWLVLLPGGLSDSGGVRRVVVQVCYGERLGQRAWSLCWGHRDASHGTYVGQSLATWDCGLFRGDAQCLWSLCVC